MKPFTDEDYIYREKLRKLAQKIDNDVDAIIVEGKSDKRILRKLGVEGHIFTCGGKVPELFCDDVARVSNKIVILTDFDEHGKELNKEFRQLLSSDVDILSSYRKQFGKLLTSRDRYCIEDLRPLFTSRFQKFVDVDLDRLFSKFH